MDSVIFKNKITYILLGYFLILILWWIKINFLNASFSSENHWYGLAYSFIALIGGVNGLIISQKWGGLRSLFGRGIAFLSLGLLAYWFGQTTWSFYNIVLKIEAPYPSAADIGYFSAIIFYAFGMVSLAKTSGAKLSLGNIKGKTITFIIPLIILSASYFIFLREATPDLAHPVLTFLNYGTPLGYAISLSLALVSYGLTRGVLGGKMQPRILLIIFAFIVEYMADFTFLYQFASGTYINGGINDLMFTTSFLIMALGLLSFKSVE